MPTLLVPQYRQLTALLDYVKTMLRTDDVILRYMEPVAIVAATAEFPPIRSDGQRIIWDTELPVVCCWETRSTPIQKGGRWGESVELSLIYAFKQYVGSAGVPGEAWSQRISKLVYWRLCRHLQIHKWPNNDDFLTTANIHSITPGPAVRLSGDGFEGFEMDLQMVHLHAPVDETAAPLLDAVETTEKDTVTTVQVIGRHEVNA